MRWPIALTLAVLLAACSSADTPPRTQIDRLRVLSVRIDGPQDPASPSGQRFAEIKPGEAATLTPVVLAPGIAPVDEMTVGQTVCLEDYHQPRWDRGGPACPSKTADVLRFWFWCPPQAATLYDDPCTRTDVLGSPGAVLSTEGIEPLGPTCEAQAAAALPTPAPTACVKPRSDLFEGEPSDALVRQRGVLMNVLLLTIIDVDGDHAAGRFSELIDKLQARSIPAVLSLKRVPVLDQPTNHNPVITALSGSSGAIENGSTLGHDEHLGVSAEPAERYDQVNLDGTVTSRTEKLDIAWLSGFGRFDDAHTLLEESNTFDPATGDDIDLPPPGTGDYSMPFVVVARDQRGGEAWFIVREAVVPRP